MSSGLGAVASNESEIRRKGQILAHMLDLLRGIPNQETSFTRKNVIDVLTIIHNTIGQELEFEIGRFDDTIVNAEHHVSLMIRGLKSSLEDLDSGKTDLILRASKYGAPGSLSWRQRETDQVLRDALLICQRAWGTKTQRETAMRLARCLTQKKVGRRGKTLTGNQLIRLKYT